MRIFSVWNESTISNTKVGVQRGAELVWRHTKEACIGFRRAMAREVTGVILFFGGLALKAKAL